MIRSQFTFNKVQETSLRIVSGINHSSFKNLSRKCKKITIHESVDDRNLQDYEWYNSTNYGKFFSYYEKIRRNARNVQEISNENRKTVKYGIEAISNRNPLF